jgi:hypothetical protein
VAEACGALGDLINEVNAQAGKKLSPPAAAAFVAETLAIEDALSCP